ncbi:MAG: serine/threonine-protein kinase, partial [Polyangiaceae bacterium]
MSDPLVAGRFELGPSIGAGGMGAVYAAVDRMTGEKVAVKVLRGQSASDRERFAREARVLSELRHPGVVRYIAHGSAMDEAPYLAMEWLDGEDLGQRLQREGLSYSQTVKMITRVADTLSAAHARGIIHRDLKPSNLYLPGGDIERVKLLDFGIARVGAAVTHGTKHGSILGTPAYMSPEQARGDRALDARTDVFALGCVMFECLTGQPPFVGEHVLAVLAKILLEESPHAREVRASIPEPLDRLVARMMNKSADLRPESAAAVATELGSMAVSDEMLGSPPPAEAVASITTFEQRLVSVVLIG